MDPDESHVFDNIFMIYQDIIRTDVTHYESKRKKLVFPLIPLPIFRLICKRAMACFKQDPILLKIDSECIIIGDLHGHILDLFRIFAHFGFPPLRNYLFLGDIVDRGEFSAETLILIFVLKILYPRNVFIIRGNHEFSEMIKFCGFSGEISKMYGSSLVEKDIIDAFSYVPLAALIFDEMLCVHGGIGPTFKSISQINNLSRPIHDFNSEPLNSLLWSDPCSFIQQFRTSTRGTGYLYGIQALHMFLMTQNLKVLVRGHECVDDGVSYQLNQQVITVFSASFYCGIDPNKSGVLVVNTDKSTEAIRFPALRYLLRSSASFVPTDCSSPTISLPVKKSKKKIPKTDVPKDPEAGTGRSPSLPTFSTYIVEPQRPNSGMKRTKPKTITIPNSKPSKLVSDSPSLGSLPKQRRSSSTVPTCKSPIIVTKC